MVNCSLFWANQRQRWNENPKCWFDCCSNDLFGVYHIQTQCKIDIDKAIYHLFCFSFFGRIFVGITTLFVSQLQKGIVFAIANRWDYTHFFFCFYSPCVKKMMICHHAQQNPAPLMWHVSKYTIQSVGVMTSHTAILALQRPVGCCVGRKGLVPTDRLERRSIVQSKHIFTIC